jgi:hypothetical protein
MNVFTSSSQFSKSEATTELQAMRDLANTKTVTFSTNNDLCYVSHFFDMPEEDYEFLYNKPKRERLTYWKLKSVLYPGAPRKAL